MSVLIKEMKLPQSCAFCGIAIMCYTADGIHNGMVKKDGRLLSCPLVEVLTPHGRLIDAKRLKAAFLDEFIMYDSTLSVAEPFPLIDNAPTVIEAEE